ncbi:MAG: hypothetical protein WBG50_01740 [Desulfomonilaceae bacterium]
MLRSVENSERFATRFVDNPVDRYVYPLMVQPIKDALQLCLQERVVQKGTRAGIFDIIIQYTWIRATGPQNHPQELGRGLTEIENFF